MYPETPWEEFESLYFIWQYSEMVTDPILNNEPFSEIFPFEERSYESFYEMIDNEDGTRVMDNLRNIYGENISIKE